MHTLLVINPGSTSTKIAIYQGENQKYSETLYHTTQELAPFSDISEQHLFRKQTIEEWLKCQGLEKKSLSAIVARGGLLKPIPSGVYRVNDEMLSDLRAARYGKHASNLAALIAHEFAEELDIPAYVVDPVVVDELEPVARISGCPEIPRRSIFHALNQKAMARQAAKELGVSYEHANLVVVHLGGGISIGAHYQGRVIDVNNALDGEGPFSPERAGTLPATKVVEYCFAANLPYKELFRRLVGKGGLVAHLQTNDGRQVEEMIAAGDKTAEFYYHAMAYQISKEIGRAGAVLKGQVDAVVLTGGLAYSKLLTTWIKEYVSYLGRIMVLPGENELEALALGGLRVLMGKEVAKEYPNGR